MVCKQTTTPGIRGLLASDVVYPIKHIQVKSIKYSWSVPLSSHLGQFFLQDLPREPGLPNLSLGSLKILISSLHWSVPDLHTKDAGFAPSSGVPQETTSNQSCISSTRDKDHSTQPIKCNHIQIPALSRQVDCWSLSSLQASLLPQWLPSFLRRCLSFPRAFFPCLGLQLSKLSTTILALLAVSLSLNCFIGFVIMTNKVVPFSLFELLHWFYHHDQSSDSLLSE